MNYRPVGDYTSDRERRGERAAGAAKLRKGDDELLCSHAISVGRC